jgi:hypothetical protein
MENYKEYLYDKEWLKSKNLFIDIFQFKTSLKYHYRGGIIDTDGKERYKFYSPILGFENKDDMLDEANRMINKMLKNPIEERWETVPMSEVWDLIHKYTPEEHKKNIQKPNFPTKRWGDITTKISTTDKKSIEFLLEKLKFENKK